MLVEVTFVNGNACGQNSIETFKSITELKTRLNEMLYYSEEVYLLVEQFNEEYKYSETNDLLSIFSSAKHYNNEVKIVTTFQ